MAKEELQQSTKAKQPSAIDNALQKFSEMLIKRMEEMQKDWTKGWVTGGVAGLPQNITGRTYEGCNAFLLQLHTAEQNYKVPAYMTFLQIKKEGAKINKGEKAIPVFKWGFSIKDKDGNKITEKDYNNLSEADKKECKVRPYMKVFAEWNIDQTNLQEVNKEKYEKILSRFESKELPEKTEGMYVNAALDRMMEKQEWVCPIQYDKPEAGAYYSPSKDMIVLPLKSQFNIHQDNAEECYKDGQEYYGTALHEMTHSTGAESRLNRLKPSRFGSPEYAKEELVAELTAAMVGNTLGFDKRISDNSAAYIKSWISTLKQEPKFIVTVMSDVNKASRMLIDNIDKQRIALGEAPLVQGSLDGKDEKENNEKQLKGNKELMESKEEIKEKTNKEWQSLKEKPTIEMESGDKLSVEYNKEKDTLDVVIKDAQGKEETHSTLYDHDREIKENIGYVWEEISNMPQYQKQAPVQKDLSNPRDYFSVLIDTITDGHHEGHTALNITTLNELREYYKDKPELKEWITAASDKELMDAGANKLPKITNTQNTNNMEEKYYYSHSYFQMEEDKDEFEELREKGDYKGILKLAEYYDQGDSLEQDKTFKNAKKYPGDDILCEDDNYAVVYNNNVGGTYDLMRKVSKQDIIDSVERYGLEDDASEDVKEVVYANIAKQFSEIKKMPAFTMPNEEIVYFQYNQEKNQIEAGSVTNIGLNVQHRFDYNAERSIDENLELAYEELSEMPEYQKTESEEEENEEDEEKSLEKGEEATSIKEYVESLKDKNLVLTGDFTLLPKDSEASRLSKVLEETEKDYENYKFSSTPINQEELGKKQLAYYNALENLKKELDNQINNNKQQSVHEDSNIETDVAGKAKEIAASGVPMEEAEKEAKSISDAEQHEEYHKEQEVKEENERKRENNNEGSNKLLHASLLLGALASAKENGGIWMNKDGKRNADFMYSKTPITAYNNMMMNLYSDQKEYRSNNFVFYNAAQENGVGVRRGEKALTFNWTKWEYQDITNKDNVISKDQYDKLSPEEQKLYEKNASRITQYIYNIDQTTLPSVDKETYAKIVQENSKPEVKEKKGITPLIAQYKDLKGKHPDALLLFRTGDFYVTYKEDAVKTSNILGITLRDNNKLTDENGKSIKEAGFPYHALDTFLPKLIRAGQRVAICDQLDSQKKIKSDATKDKYVKDATEIASKVAKNSGIKYDTVYVMQNDKYDKESDKITISTKYEKTDQDNAIQKANDIYRVVVASTGVESRLDRSGRNKLLPEDDVKHEKLIQELAAGVLMSRQGLPASISKENQTLIPYWERELRENPQFIGIIERDVNNAVETIDNLVQKKKVDYEAIRGQLPQKTLQDPQKITIASELAKLPSIETKEIVVVKDKAAKKADVIMPAGASFEEENEVPGMRKDRIGIALNKEGIREVRFYNAGGSLGLKKPNSYFLGKEITLNKLKQYRLINRKVIDLTDQLKQGKGAEIVKFQAIKGDKGKYAFYIKAKDEPSFSVYPPKEHINTFFNVINKPEQKITHMALAQKWYEIASQKPDIKVDLISPKKVDVDMSKIIRPTITSSSEDHNKKIISATINGKRETAPITKDQWNKMWLADNMAEYKKALSAVVFEPLLKKEVEEQHKEGVKEEEKGDIKESPSPKKEQEESEEKSSRGIHM